MRTPEDKSFIPKENIKLAEKIKTIMHHMRYKEGSTAFVGCTKMLQALDMNPDLVYDKNDPEKWLNKLQKKGIIDSKEFNACLDIITSEIHFESPTEIEKIVSESEYSSKDEIMWDDAWYEAVEEFTKEYPGHKQIVENISTMYQKSRLNKDDFVDDFIIQHIRSGLISPKDEKKYIDIIANIQEKAQIKYEKKQQNFHS